MPTVAPRIALIHALAHSIAPVNAELDRAWPGCVRMHLLDDSLSADLAASERGLDDAMTARFVALGDYAVATGVRGILFTCSAFGTCIDAVARRFPDIPVLKPHEAMIADASRIGRRIGLVASFAPTLASMPAEFPESVSVLPVLADGALDALTLGDAQPARPPRRAGGPAGGGGRMRCGRTGPVQPRARGGSGRARGAGPRSARRSPAPSGCCGSGWRRPGDGGGALGQHRKAPQGHDDDDGIREDAAVDYRRLTTDPGRGSGRRSWRRRRRRRGTSSPNQPRGDST